MWVKFNRVSYTLIPALSCNSPADGVNPILCFGWHKFSVSNIGYNITIDIFSKKLVMAVLDDL